MNKIECAIHDCKNKIDFLEIEEHKLLSKIKAYNEMLQLLELIQNNKHIPNETISPIRTN